MDYSGNYYYNDYSSAATGLLAGAAVGFLIFFLIIVFLFIAVYVVSLWKVFKKAGKNGWEAIIPVYNSYVLFEISGYPGWYVFLGFIPFAGAVILLVFQIMAYMSLAKKFGKSDVFGVLTVFFPIICFPILAFGSSTYDSSLGENKIASQLIDNTQTDTTNEDKNFKFCPNCGKKANEDADVCSECGTNFNEEK